MKKFHMSLPQNGLRHWCKNATLQAACALLGQVKDNADDDDDDGGTHRGVLVEGL